MYLSCSLSGLIAVVNREDSSASEAEPAEPAVLNPSEPSPVVVATVLGLPALPATLARALAEEAADIIPSLIKENYQPYSLQRADAVLALTPDRAPDMSSFCSCAPAASGRAAAVKTRFWPPHVRWLYSSG